MLPHAANYFEFLFKNRSLLLALSALFREETTPNVLLIWIVLRPTYTTVLIDPHPHQKPVFQHDHCAIYEYDGTVSLTHSLISWLNRCIVRVVLVSIWSYTHISLYGLCHSIYPVALAHLKFHVKHERTTLLVSAEINYFPLKFP